MIWHKGISSCTGNNKHGFTLAELMIVLAIMGILLGISVPNMQTYTLRTEKNSSKINSSCSYGWPECISHGEQRILSG
jgi:prepilin-type N-terminal cleavage/methylation domain-containing protein